MVQYASATPAVVRSPAVRRSDSSTIVRTNLMAASREKVHGTRRTTPERLRGLTQVAQRVVADEVWGADAIDTASNPGPETVREILSLLGVGSPWKVIETQFASRWLKRQAVTPGLKSVAEGPGRIGIDIALEKHRGAQPIQPAYWAR